MTQGDQRIRRKEWWENFWSKEEQNLGQARTAFLNIAAQHVEGIPRNQVKVVDIGSGDGRYAIPFAQQGHDSWAVEITHTGISRIKQYAQKASVQVHTIEGDFIDLGKEKQEFHIVVSSGLLEEISPPYLEDTIKGFMNWTLPGGLNIIRYCLEISERGKLVPEGFVAPRYEAANWKILMQHEELEMRDSIAPINFENRLRTGTIIAIKPEK